MILDATTKSIEIDLAEAHTTNAMPVTVDYVDLTTTTTTAGSSDTASNGTTAVTIVAAPAASTQRKVNFISVFNADTVSHVTTIQLNNNTTLRTITEVTLSAGETLQYTDVAGWALVTSAGVYALLAGSTTQAFSCSTLTAATGILGKTDGSNAGAGYIGEIISSSVASGSAVSLTTATAANISSITLTPGRWLVFTQTQFIGDGSTSITIHSGGMNTTSATYPSGNRYVHIGAAFVPSASVGFGSNAGPYYISVSTNTAVYHIARATFTVSTLSAYGTIQAVRI